MNKKYLLKYYMSIAALFVCNVMIVVVPFCAFTFLMFALINSSYNAGSWDFVSKGVFIMLSFIILFAVSASFIQIINKKS